MQRSEHAAKGPPTASNAVEPRKLEPAPEMRRLIEAFEGRWSITEEYVPQPTMPNGGVGRGEEVWRPGPGGLSLIEEYRSQTPTGDFVGLGIIWWDAQAQRFQVVWCANDLPAGCFTPSDGMKWTGDQLVLLDERVTDTSTAVFKETFSQIVRSSFTQTLELGNTRGEVAPIMRIRAHWSGGQ